MEKKMSEQEKTHYRKAFNSPYLSSADITEPVTLTIRSVVLEVDKTNKTKDSFNTAYFVEKEIRQGEPLKPMILNAINSHTMKEITGSYWIEEWQNIQVQVYVDPNVRFGRDTVEGLRIQQVKVMRELSPDDIDVWARAIGAYKRDGDLHAVKAHMIVSAEHEQLIKEQAQSNITSEIESASSD